MASDRPPGRAVTGRRAHRRARALVVVAALTCGGVSACSSGSSGATTQAASTCALSAKAVPSCGVLWGVTTERPTAADLAAAESAAGRRFDLVYRFHDLNDEIPTADERSLVQQGRTLHVSIDSRDFSPGSLPITWKQVAAGDYDASLTQQAEGIASLREPVFVTFEHEMDQPRKAALGSPADFVAAWRHVHKIFDEAGAGNAVWTWVVTGYEPQYELVGTLWPGNDAVDWISWEAYNTSGCQRGTVDPSKQETFEESMSPFHTWLVEHGAEYGIDTTKPMMISEAGSVTYPGDPSATVDWYASIPDVLRRYPQIKAVGLWDHTGTGGAACDFRFNRTPEVAAAVARAGQDSRLRVTATP